MAANCGATGNKTDKRQKRKAEDSSQYGHEFPRFPRLSWMRFMRLGVGREFGFALRRPKFMQDWGAVGCALGSQGRAHRILGEKRRNGVSALATADSGLNPQSFQQFRGSHHLAGVALRMIGHVNECAAHAGGQLLASDAARLIVIADGQDTNADCGLGERCFEFGEEIGERFGAGLLSLHGCELVRGELGAFGVGKNAVDGARDVLEVERHGGKTPRPRVDLGVCEAVGPFADVIERQFERVENGTADSRDVRMGAAKPGFGVRSGRSGSAHDWPFKYPSYEVSMRIRSASGMSCLLPSS